MTSPSEFAQRARLALYEACAQLQLDHDEPMLVADGWQVVFRCNVQDQRGSEHLVANRATDVAIRVVGDERQWQHALKEHAIASGLSNQGGPVSRPLHAVPLATSHGLVGLWEWIDQGPRKMPIARWGEALKQLHQAGAALEGFSPFDPLQGTRPRDAAIIRALDDPQHPFHGQPHIVDIYEAAVNDALRVAGAAAAGLPHTLVHGDWHPSNCMITKTGEAIAFDWECAGWGPVAADFALAALGVKRFGWPSSHLDELREGYGEGAPTDAEVEPFRRLLDLSFVGYGLLFGATPDGASELAARWPVVADVDAVTPTWVILGNVAKMRPYELLAPSNATLTIG